MITSTISVAILSATLNLLVAIVGAVSLSPGYTTTTLWSPAVRSAIGTIAVPFSSNGTSYPAPSTITVIFPVAFAIGYKSGIVHS